MDKERILFILFSFIIFCVILYIIKIYFLDTLLAHRILRKKKGFNEIKEIPKVVQIFIDKNKHEKKEITVKKIIKKGDLYILDIFSKSRNSTARTSMKYSTLLIKEIDTGLTDCYVRKKLTGFWESLLVLDNKNKNIVIEDSVFNTFFVAYSVNTIKLPDEIINHLNKEKENFPFNITIDAPNIILFIAKEGYSLSVERVTKKEDLDSLIDGFGDLNFNQNME